MALISEWVRPILVSKTWLFFYLSSIKSNDVKMFHKQSGCVDGIVMTPLADECRVSECCYC